MTDQLKDLLLEHYGELMQEHQNTADFFERGKLVDRMNAINLLLGLPKVKRTTLSDIIREIEKDK